MTDLIQFDNLEIPAEVVTALREELTAGGLTMGTLLLGGIDAMPGMAYLLWHASGEVPTSMTTRKEDLFDPEATRQMAHIFLGKWSHRHS